ncbi:kinase-like domain-containing protein [Cercophora samala]|uniref:non-specific serine/threonine protein kinase n=1 Tax=Cercophora samala TaxID=330535 RepID=A0AA39ZJX2_9PEZI|nr:kinase-like domain-containing protein [Cercophora samala]
MSFDSAGSSQSITQSQPITLDEFLDWQDDGHFIWDDLGRETDEAWIRPVERAGLDDSKHKVFHHGNKEYIRAPHPFIQIGEQLGESGTTVVYRVNVPEGYPYRRQLALKVITCKDNLRPPGPDSHVRMLALEEVRTMASIKHPHIVVYVASFEDYCISTREVRRQQRPKVRAIRVDQQIKKHILGIAMYPPAQCNLSFFMNQIINSREPDYEAALHTYFGCLSQAVAFLHRSNIRIRHKDIKPENIVIDDFLLPVLTDFGLSKHFETGQHSEGPTPKTLKYADPEAINETQRDERSDVFSLGCVFLEMATTLLGRPPVFAEQQLKTTDNLSEFKYSESLDRLDAYLYHLCQIADFLAASDPTKAESAAAIKEILPVIRAMMDADFTRRPMANDLYPLFRRMAVIGAGACGNCEAERETGRAVPRLRRTHTGSPVMTRTATMNTTISLVRRGSTMNGLTGMVVHDSPTDLQHRHHDHENVPPHSQANGNVMHSQVNGYDNGVLHSQSNGHGTYGNGSQAR